MKKYLNKGLLYEWFNAAKFPILIGLITWGFFAHSILEESVMRIKNMIGTAQSNNFSSVDLRKYFILGVIFLAIYIFANGNNKRNTTMFLCSGPHTKKQIKFNELICLLITLGLYTLMYIYMAATIYIRNNELMSIVNGFFPVTLLEVIRLLLFGTLGILLMIEIDLLFSNSIIAYFGMIALGMSTIFILSKFRVIISYFGSYGSLMDSIFGNIVYGHGYTDGNFKRLSILFCQGPFYVADIDVIFKGILFLMVFIGVMFFIFNVLERRAKLETVSKIFSSKANENIIVIYLSLGVGAFINMILLEIIFRDWRHMVIQGQEYLTSNSIKMLSIDLIILALTTFVSYKVLKKILSTIG
ncbi:hypothetical protein CDLVIII_4371 [Clostridium sp. DL-VIII]|uniref:hypothetical protein n=1 Tax=Clostridium sp. DL-VIII TaxID=641107 RepID=UPI00023B05AF|nr:hypothetical protein [Clostridium sp. DL-VIII]EHJ00883.1 hypothetical protein CDLVIII_4371 [Clostridium sp. DL-VIII]